MSGYKLIKNGLFVMLVEMTSMVIEIVVDLMSLKCF